MTTAIDPGATEFARTLVLMGPAKFASTWAGLDPDQRRETLNAMEALESSIDWTSPGTLAQSLDPLTIQTPALELIDGEMVANYRSSVESHGATEGLLFSMAPQEGKSTRITRYGSLWMLHENQDMRLGIVSYSDENAARISRQIRNDIEVFTGEGGLADVGLRLARGSQAASRWDLTAPHKGGVYAVSIGGGLTGHPLDALLIDDPVKDARDADSLLKSSQAWEWWVSVGRPRLAGAYRLRWLVMTRWHEADLSGRMQAKEAEDRNGGAAHFDKWRVVNVPAQADHDPEAGEFDVLHREVGEFLQSARQRTTEEWEATKATTPARFWTSMFQGRPAPALGEIWIKTWWRRYDEPMWTRMADGTYRVANATLIQSWDCAFKDTESSDYVCGQVWAKRGAEAFLIWQIWDHLSFTETVAAVQRMSHLFPQAHRKLIEDKANGTAAINSLKKSIPGIAGVSPTDSKTGRAVAVTPFLLAGNVYLPTEEAAHVSPELSFDVDGFVLEATAFPTGAHDDQVDAASQALYEMYVRGGEGSISSPSGQVPRGNVRRTGAQLSPVQRRLTQQALRRPGGSE